MTVTATQEIVERHPAQVRREDPERELWEPEVEAEDTDAENGEPYDPSKIRIQRETPTVDLLMKRIQHGELILTPSFQRRPDLWTEKVQSRLIESVLMRIPLPAFYFDATDPGRWLVVDGLQRLTAMARFLLSAETLKQLGMKRQLKLRELEFLRELDGSLFERLPRRHQRTIEEAQLTAFVIGEGTPPEVKFKIFKRVNTGGLPLTSQEIRHALNQGPATKLLRSLGESEEFRRATANGVTGKRMANEEFVLRFLAFVNDPPEKYLKEDFDYFLNEAMGKINGMTAERHQDLERRFKRAMRAAERIFGAFAFRKQYAMDAGRMPINKALFETWSFNLNLCSDDELETLIRHRIDLQRRFVDLCNVDTFNKSISLGTGAVSKIKERFTGVHRIIQDTIGSVARVA